jgi:predicted membrane protein
LSIAGSLKATIMTLLAWTTAGTLVHGIGEIALAFLVRGVGRNVASRR